MKRALSNRVGERLRRLRERFGEGVQDRHVDDDHDNLTSPRPEHIPLRTFFLGEIWWTHRISLDRRPYRDGSSHLPALVTRKQPCPGEPVEIAPARQRNAVSSSRTDFEAAGIAGLWSETVFSLTLRRPVARTAVGHQLATLNGLDKQRLARAMEALRGPAEDDHA